MLDLRPEHYEQYLKVREQHKADLVMTGPGRSYKPKEQCRHYKLVGFVSNTPLYQVLGSPK